MNAPEILTKAAGHLADRAVTYDQPEGERSMAKTVAVFNLYHGTQLTEAHGWHFMQILKDVRLFSRDGYHADSAEDCTAYAALKAEAMVRAAQPAEVVPLGARCPSCGVTHGPDVHKGDCKLFGTIGIEPAVVQHVELFNAMTMKGKREPVGPDVEFDQSGRMDPIGQNGNTGEHYDLPSTDALVDPTGKPTWDMAPIWANYLAQDASGVWKWWNKRPEPGVRTWCGKGMCSEANSGEVRGNWRETLEHAPGLTKTEKRA